MESSLRRGSNKNLFSLYKNPSLQLILLNFQSHSFSRKSLVSRTAKISCCVILFSLYCTISKIKAPGFIKKNYFCVKYYAFVLFSPKINAALIIKRLAQVFKNSYLASAQLYSSVMETMFSWLSMVTHGYFMAMLLGSILMVKNGTIVQ